MLTYALSAFALAGAAMAQATNSGSLATELQLEVVQANFEQAQLAGEDTYLVPDFQPQGVLNVTFGQQAISIGQKIPQSETSSTPTFAVYPGQNGTRINLNSTYTIMMVDADVVGTNEATTPQTRHWLANGVRLQAGQNGGAPYSINYTGSTSVTDYAGPGPASGSGSHRYTILLYAQSSAFAPPANLTSAGVGMGTWILEQYVSGSGLGPLVAANYFQVENGQATATVPQTSTVNAATLPAAQSTASASGASASAGSASRSGASSGTSNAPAASSSRAAAGQTKGMGVGLIVGAVGVLGCVVGAAVGL